MGTLGTLAVSIVGDAKGLNKALDGASGRMKDVGKKMGKVGGTLTKSVTLPLLAVAGAIGGAMVKYGNFADQMLDLSAITGMSTDDLQKWRNVAVDAGVDLDASANAMGRFNKRLERGADISPALAEGIEQMNMNVEEFRGLDADEKMRAMVQQMADMDKEERVAFANKMNIPELLPMVEEVIERGGDVEDVLGDIDPAFSEEDLKTMNEFRQSWDNLKESIFLLIGEALMPLFEWFKENREMIEGKFKDALKGIGETISRLAEWWQNLAPGMKGFIKRAVVIAAVLGPVLMVVGKIVAVIGALLPVLKVLGAVFLLLTSPIGLIIAAVVGLIAIFVYLWKTNETFRDAIIAIWETIEAAAIAVFNGIKDSIKVALEWIMAFWENWGETILSVATRIWDQIKLVIDTAINLIKDIIGLILAVIRGDWEEAWERILSIGETIWNFIKGTAENVFGALRDILAGIWDNIGDKVTSVWEGIKSYISDTVTGIYETVTGWFGDLRDTVKDIWDGVLDIIKGVVNNIIGSIESMVNWSINNINKFINAINRAIDTINRIPGINIGSIPTMNEVSIPRLHSGTHYFRPPGGAREGLALLERGEQIVPRGETGGGDINNYFNIAEISVRDDTDIEKIAEQLYQLQRKRGRSV